MFRAFLFLACVHGGLVGRAEAGTMKLEQWNNGDCSGPPDKDSGANSIISAGDTCLPGDPDENGDPRWNEQSCSEDGTQISIPFFSDSTCANEIDMNAAACSDTGALATCTFPPHMTFTSGRCTQVMSGLGGLVSVSWRITITDCAGDELANLMGAGIFALILMICCPILLLCGCVYMCCIRKPQQTNMDSTLMATAAAEFPQQQQMSYGAGQQQMSYGAGQQQMSYGAGPQ